MADSVFGVAQDSDVKFELCRKASFSKMLAKKSRTPAVKLEGEDAQLSKKKDYMWKLMELYLPVTPEAIQRGIVNHVEYTLARTRFNFDMEDCYRATAYSIRDRLIETLNDTVAHFFAQDVKRCYYLSLEFLLGRAMQNALVNLDIEKEYKQALLEMGYNLEDLYEFEHDPALGNGGLGRLAACYLDSMATMNYPCWGYGIRYTYGIFEQKIVNGRQVEHPDYWLVMDNPWEICRHDIAYAVRFYGEVKTYTEPGSPVLRYRWVGGSIVQAVAYDNPIPGFDTYNCINLRLWKATPSREFDFHSFNAGRYMESVSERQSAEAISAVLYPNDNTTKGKILRLQQQYFFVCATIQDVLRRFKKRPGRDWSELPDKMAIQLNDTHPTIAIPELMRILIDVEGLEWSTAWDLTKRVFNYSNHTVLPEACEKWPQGLFESLLPRHLLIINDINFKFLTEVRETYGNNSSCISRMSIYEEGWQKMIRMANLAIIGSQHVNGVAALHSEILKKDLFKEFREFYDKHGVSTKFLNVTNGVTLRRWLHCCNRPLSHLMSEWIGSDTWLKDYDRMRELGNYVNEPSLIENWQKVKYENKKRLAEWISENCNVELDTDRMMFDIQVKRIHEYKRQLLNLLYILHRYLTLKHMSVEDRKRVQPRACMIGGKAAPGYATAKTIIKLTNNIGAYINQDNDVSSYLKVLFLPNYNVSNAMIIIPGADICHQISTAGTEASGTSCMKFVLNGGLIIGTLDGANVEIRKECGDDTMFVFGLREEEVAGARQAAMRGDYPIDERLQRVFNFIRGGAVSLGDHEAHREFVELVDRLSNNGHGHNGDFYLVCRDFPDFCRAQEQVDETYRDQQKWTQLCIKAVSRMGYFSSDRSIAEYAKDIWGVEACARAAPAQDMYTQPPSAKGKEQRSNGKNP